jgi:hypothetical protein
MGLRAFLTNRRFLVLLAGTAGCWFLLDYAYYFFTEFGPNLTTFVLPGELYPVSVRATGHGISPGVGKFGAFMGVFLFPVLQSSLACAARCC